MTRSNPNWDWTFHYSLSKKILPSNLHRSSNVTFVKDNQKNVIGLKIKAYTTDNYAPTEYCDRLARRIAYILAAASCTAIYTHLSGYEGMPKEPGKLGRSTRNFRIVYDIKGSPVATDRVDLTASNIQHLITSSDESNVLVYLNNAVSQFCKDDFIGSIKEGFKVIEESKSLPSYCRFKCIRDIVSHQEDQKPRWSTKTTRNFGKYFGSNLFDFKKPFDQNKGIIVLDFESNKTKRTLKRVAKELIAEAKGVLQL